RWPLRLTEKVTSSSMRKRVFPRSTTAAIVVRPWPTLMPWIYMANHDSWASAAEWAGVAAACDTATLFTGTSPAEDETRSEQPASRQMTAATDRQRRRVAIMCVGDMAHRNSCEFRYRQAQRASEEFVAEFVRIPMQSALSRNSHEFRYYDRLPRLRCGL